MIQRRAGCDDLINPLPRFNLMSPVALQFANGNVFFVGLALSVLAALLRAKAVPRAFRFLLNIAAFLGIALVILSATPLPLWLYALWVALFIGARLVRAWGKSAAVVPLLFTYLSLVIFLTELPYHSCPRTEIQHDKPVFVLGDSISAGMGSKERTWPEVLGELSHLKVTNLAQPGGTVGSALKQASAITESDAVVIVEIGGNDLLGGANSQTFRMQLDQLLAKLRGQNCQVVMFELPLPPFANAFGQAQRSLAKKYQVALIPKHYLTRLFGSEGATLDGLHLSDDGHRALAKAINAVLTTRN